MLSDILGFLPSIREWFETIREGRREKDKKLDEALRALYIAISETRIYIAMLNNPPYASGLPLASKPRKSKSALEPFLGAGSNPRLLDGPPLNPQQIRIIRLWREAALKLRYVDRDLAQRCAIKSEYWTNPEEWSVRRIRRARIDIDRIFREAQELL